MEQYRFGEIPTTMDRPVSDMGTGYRGQAQAQVPVRPSVQLAEEMGLEILEVQKVTDTTGMKVLRVVTYVVVIVTCLAALIFLFMGYQLVMDIQEAVDKWLASFTTGDMLGE